MSVGSILSSGLQGVQAGISRTDRAGGQIARAGATNGAVDLAAPIVDLKVGEIQVKASLAAIKAGDEMLGSLIDIRA